MHLTRLAGAPQLRAAGWADSNIVRAGLNITERGDDRPDAAAEHCQQAHIVR